MERKILNIFSMILESSKVETRWKVSYSKENKNPGNPEEETNNEITTETGFYLKLAVVVFTEELQEP